MSAVPSTDATNGDPSGRYHSGDVIAERYRLLEEVGRGGMGTVWLARNRLLEIDVAVKLIELDRNDDHEVLARRVLQEARTSARLAHSSVARVFDYGKTPHGDPFIVSEFLRGESLEERIERSGAIDAIEAVRMILPIVDALAVAHAEDIVHRDVKSGNIFLARDPSGRIQPKLLDFGIANFVSQKVKITHEGSLLGTPAYMPPEQARGQDVDFRADVWALCVVLYEMLTGELPFTGPNYNAVLYAIINDQPPPLSDRGVSDTDLQRLIDRGLKKDPEVRWSAMREIGEALALWLFERGVRVDICGAALRTTWLESGLSGIHIEVSDSVPPPPPTSERPRYVDPRLPTLADVSRRSMATLEADTAAVEPQSPSSSPKSFLSSSRSRWLGLGAGALLGGVAVVVLITATPRGSRPAPDGVATASAAEAHRPVFSSVPEQPDVAPANAPPEPSPTDSESEPVVPSPSVEEPVPAKPPPTRASRPIRKPVSTKKKYDFGF